MNAYNKPALPNVASAVDAWSSPLTVIFIGKKQVDFKTEETSHAKRTFGTFAPMKAQQVAMKTEGERAWAWYSLFCSPTLELGTDDVVIIEGVRCRVMGKKNYAQYGYFEYELIQDFKKK
jgi:hypothetical protein